MGGGLRRAAGLVVAAVGVAGVAGCGGGGHPAAAVPASAAVASGLSAAELRGALLTHVNGVAAAGPASSGQYAAVAASTGRRTVGVVQVVPAACAAVATNGFDPAALAAVPAAAVTFRIDGNGVSEVLAASSAVSAAAAIAWRVPAGCARYQEKSAGKTVTCGVTEQAVTGIGQQARMLGVHADGAVADDLWALIYRGAGFVGTVTVSGPNASELAVRELGQQAYAFAAKSLA